MIRKECYKLWEDKPEEKPENGLVSRLEVLGNIMGS